MNKISNLAYIEDGAIIGDDVLIEPFVYIGKDVKLANGVKILSHCKITGSTDIGENSVFHPFSVIGGDPQDISYEGENTKLIIGKNNIVRESVTINKGTLKEDGSTVIGDNNLIMATVHIAHDCKLENNIIIANACGIAGHVRIGENAFIGAMSGIHQFVHIGEHSMLGGGSAITQDLPPYCLAEGNRASIRSLNVTGIRRRFDKEDISALSRAYKELFRSEGLLKDIAEKLISSNNEKVVKLAQFILNTKRGIPR